MGCCQSATATRPGAAATQGADAPNLTEVPAHERSIGELKRIFEGVNANEQGHANKVELAASLEKERNLDTLLKEAEMNEIMVFVNKITQHDGEFVSWDEFMQFARVAVAETVAKEVKETILHEVERKIEEVKQEVQEGAEKLEQEVAHEVEEFKKEVAADVAAGRQALAWLKERFESLIADEEGAVSKEELASKLKESEDVEGPNISDLIGQAGLNPSWNSFAELDSNKDGKLSWEEFKAHVCGDKEIEEVDIVVEETAVTQRCWGCC